MAKGSDKDKNAPPIIVKKIKKVEHGHHGGAWKVAYADFVTAMMAFFLLLWLLQATTEEQKLGIADYFAPSAVSRSSSGSGGMMGGRTYTEKGDLPHDQSPVAVTIELPEPPEDWETEGEPAGTVAEEGEGPEVGTAEPDENDLQELLAKREEEQFEKAEEALRQAIESVPDLRELAENLMIDRTPEGMRIQIVDQDGSSMFPNGSAEMFEHTRRLLALVVDAVRQMPQQIAIKGHTDAKRFSDRSNYTNWELSTDRANASRRALLDSGLPATRVASVAGLADTDPLDPEHPHAPQNRRVSIILLRENPLVAAPEDGLAPTAGPQRAAAE